jgi:hypothetical protein
VLAKRLERDDPERDVLLASARSTFGACSRIRGDRLPIAATPAAPGAARCGASGRVHREASASQEHLDAPLPEARVPQGELP